MELFICSKVKAIICLFIKLTLQMQNLEIISLFLFHTYSQTHGAHLQTYKKMRGEWRRDKQNQTRNQKINPRSKTKSTKINNETQNNKN